MRSATLITALLALAGCQSDYEVVPEAPNVDPGTVTECEFTPISGSQLSVYDCNPVFTTDEGGVQVDSTGFHSTLVAGHPFYQLFYSARPSGQDTGWQLRYAASPDGTNFEDHPDNPLLESQPGRWDQDSMDAIQVVWDAQTAQYVLTYQGVTLPDPNDPMDQGRWGMGVATSPDGKNWTPHPSNPVIDFNALAGSGLEPYLSPCWPLALTKTEAGYTGYIAAQWVDPFDFSGSMPQCDVYEATASSTSTWNLSETPVMTAGGSYDNAGVAGSSVVEFQGTLYMFYIGFEDWVQGNGYVSSQTHHLLLATSTDDGVTWQKQGGPLPVSLTDEGLVSGIGAQVVGSRIHLWVTDFYEDLDAPAVGYYLYEPDIDPHP